MARSAGFHGDPRMEHAQALLHGLAEWTVLAVNAIAILVVLAGSLGAFARGVRWCASPAYAARVQPRGIWLTYARWLVAALTFQLASDIVETTIAPTLEDIGRLAAIAAIRTFLNYFLEKDLREMGEQRPGRSAEAGREAGGRSPAWRGVVVAVPEGTGENVPDEGRGDHFGR
jgi:uncharacterized membrane protein